MTDRDDSETLPTEAVLAFAPLHKRAFGVAVGFASGLILFLITVISVLRGPHPGFSLGLLRIYFAGYTVSWTGAVIGFGWGFLVGFVAAWFLAFCRNVILALSIFVIRARSELSATRDFLDHI